MRTWWRTGSGVGYHTPPECLVAEERDDHSWFSALKADCGGACAAVMNNGLDAGEEPGVRGVVEEVDVFRDIEAFAEVAPAF